MISEGVSLLIIKLPNAWKKYILKAKNKDKITKINEMHKMFYSSPFIYSLCEVNVRVL